MDELMFSSVCPTWPDWFVRGVKILLNGWPSTSRPGRSMFFLAGGVPSFRRWKLHRRFATNVIESLLGFGQDCAQRVITFVIAASEETVHIAHETIHFGCKFCGSTTALPWLVH